MKLAIGIVGFIAFSAWTIRIMLAHGVFGFLELAAREAWGAQLFVDLGIALLFAVAWIHSDGKKRGLPWLPYALFTPFIGSPVLFAYLIHREVVALKKPAPSSAP
ncbi:MAG: hypothetical protein DI536_01645 [Archangium gephyra]|uniref:DUF2834 domain-containing protein n=1 Tax=Archangium gephyra TaxID=48 RepID=A0A2W5W5Z6_9BACT|nr:MAG: hypothetical protein DI536_01645 [Archangium gephyra]